MNRRGLMARALGGAAATMLAGKSAASADGPLSMTRGINYGYGYPQADQCEASVGSLIERAAAALLRDKVNDARRRAEVRHTRRCRLKSMSDAARDAYALDDAQEVDRLWELLRMEERR